VFEEENHLDVLLAALSLIADFAHQYVGGMVQEDFLQHVAPSVVEVDLLLELAKGRDQDRIQIIVINVQDHVLIEDHLVAVPVALHLLPEANLVLLQDLRQDLHLKNNREMQNDNHL